MRAIRNFGQIPGQHFRHAFLGGNYKMTDVCAAIGCAQVGKIDRLHRAHGEARSPR